MLSNKKKQEQHHMTILVDLDLMQSLLQVRISK